MVLSVRGKLLGAFGGLSLMVLLVSSVALHELGRANQRFTGYVEGIALRGSTVAAVRDAVDRRAIAARNLVLIDKPGDLTLEKAAVEQAHSDVQTHLRDLQRMISSHGDVSDEAKRLVREIARVEGNYGPVALAIVDLALQGNRKRGGREDER